VRAVRIAFSFLTVSGMASAGIRFDDFASTQGLRLVGNASVKETAMRLTAASTSLSGAVWAVEKQSVGSGFDTTFRFRLTDQGGLDGADGFAFVVQNSGPNALGGRGSAGGFAVADPSFRHEKGIPWSIAVFFDTFRNESERDPSSNYIAFRAHGRPNKMRWPAERLAFTPQLPFELKDGRIHTARVRFRPPMLSVFLDDSATPVLEAAVDFSIVTDRQGAAWVGFTASTGAGYQNHDILSWSFTSENAGTSMSMVSSEISFLMSECLPDRSLCTPERAVVEPREMGYHIVLPGNLEWGASIPNPAGRTVTIENDHGIVCQDFKTQGSNGCSGPAGALIMTNRDGRTWFSVNGQKGDFKNNEGFYEFDVSIR
jgi:hypothetical protein